MNLKYKNLSAMILTGGKSSRMGRNKALLPLGNTNTITKIVTLAKTFTHDVTLITNDPASYNFLALPCHMDIYKEKGPLGGLYTAFTFMKNERGIIFPCDLPFLQEEYIYPLILESKAYDVVIYQVRDQIHPLFGCYHKKVLPLIKKHLEKNDLRMQNLLQDLNVKVLDAENFDFKVCPQIGFINMNTKEQYEKAKQIILEQPL